MTRITDLVGIKYPIFQGGMAWVADWHIAAAVSEAGGLGIIGVGGADENWLRDQIKKCREATDKPFGVNLMLMNPRAPEIAKVIAEEKVKVVTTGAGSPEKYMEMWKEAGIIVVPVVAGVALAKRMQQCGADAVIAAGGIADGRGVAASFMLGAEGVQCGTVFCACEEVNVHQNYKDMVIKAKDNSTRVTGRSYGHPVRQIRNALSNKYLEMEQSGVTFEELEGLTVGSLRKAVVEGDTKEGTFMAGQIAGLVNEIRPAKVIIESMFDQADKLLGRKLEA